MTNNQKFQNSLHQLEKDLKKKEGEDYKGLGSLALYLVAGFNSALHNSECEYIRSWKADIMLIDLLIYLKDNFHYCTKIYNFNKTYKKIDKETLEGRKKLFYRWINKRFKEDLKSYEKIGYKDLTQTQQLKYALMKRFVKFDPKLIKEFKKEIGLIK